MKISKDGNYLRMAPEEVLNLHHIAGKILGIPGDDKPLTQQGAKVWDDMVDAIKGKTYYADHDSGSKYSPLRGQAEFQLTKIPLNLYYAALSSHKRTMINDMVDVSPTADGSVLTECSMLGLLDINRFIKCIQNILDKYDASVYWDWNYTTEGASV